MLLLSALMRTAHTVAGGIWVGGSILYMSVILPGLRLGGAGPQVAAQVATLFRRLVNVCIGVLLLSGMYLVFDRLAATTVGATYVIVLAVKIVAALAMIILATLQAQEARRLAKHRGRLWRLTPRWILALGIVTFFLGALLTGLYEASIAR